MKKQNIFTIIEYINSSIDIAITKKAEELYNEMKRNLDYQDDDPNAASNYESLLRKEEKEIREHISVRLFYSYYRLKINLNCMEKRLQINWKP